MHDPVCVGKFDEMDDGDLVRAMIDDGADPDEPCLCKSFVEDVDPRSYARAAADLAWIFRARYR